VSVETLLEAYVEYNGFFWEENSRKLISDTLQKFSMKEVI